MKIKVESDGTSLGTVIINEETGEKIINCIDLSIHINAGVKNSECSLLLRNIPFKYTGDTNIEIQKQVSINQVLEVLSASGKDYCERWLVSQL